VSSQSRSTGRCPPSSSTSARSEEVDQYRCGLKGQTSFAGTTRYEHIVDGELIVYTERLITIDGALQAMSLVTRSVRPEGNGSRRS
jgi:uncharacterized protein YndB with AHSA1/START domain